VVEVGGLGGLNLFGLQGFIQSNNFEIAASPP
jgi:hypothetical protein